MWNKNVGAPTVKHSVSKNTNAGYVPKITAYLWRYFAKQGWG
jgi:hypothetical protein